MLGSKAADVEYFCMGRVPMFSLRDVIEVSQVFLGEATLLRRMLHGLVSLDIGAS